MASIWHCRAHELLRILGLALIIAQTLWLFGLRGHAGAGYLIWIGVQALFSRGGLAATAPGAERASVRRAFWKGCCAICSTPRPRCFSLVCSPNCCARTPPSPKSADWPRIFLFGVIYWPCGAGGATSARDGAAAPCATLHRPPAGGVLVALGQGGAVLKRPDFFLQDA